MTKTWQSEIGAVLSLWRYPVKSMMGEELPLAQVRTHGLVGDRVYAILNRSDGKVATAKNPRTWPTLFTFKAIWNEGVDRGDNVPSVCITLPDGIVVTSEQSDLNQVLSKTLKREVSLLVIEEGRVSGVQSTLPLSWTANSEEYWPDIDGRDHRHTVTDFTLPTGTFFDAAKVHLLTISTLNQLREGYPDGDFAVQRFRPNIVVDVARETKGFSENSWIGHTLAIGDEVRLNITSPCSRCVMTTLPQGNLPKDPGILRTALQHNHGNVGVYAEVVKSGTIRPGDRIRIET
jgi:uncharacterized protein YcbX